VQDHDSKHVVTTDSSQSVDLDLNPSRLREHRLVLHFKHWEGGVVATGTTATESQQNEPLSRNHYIDLRSGRFDKTKRQDLRLLFDTFAQHQYKDNLVVHFHGGLVSEKSGLEIAARLSDTYEAAGAYPVFFVWQSQWYETIRNNLGKIFRENIFQHLLKRVLQFAVAKIDQQGGQRGPQLELPPVADVERELSQSGRPFPNAIVPGLPVRTKPLARRRKSGGVAD
jgi:hypothetical protein